MESNDGAKSEVGLVEEITNPVKVEFDDIKMAYRRLEDIFPKTPCTVSNLSTELKMDLFLKQEFVLDTGSYVERGVCNFLMQREEKSGVITASYGNLGIALAYYMLNNNPTLECTVVFPTTTPKIKITKTQKFGATVIIHGTDLSEAQSHAMEISQERGLYYLDGSDHPFIIEGNGMIGLEIMEQLPRVDAVVVPVGGGGLLAGIAVAVKTIKPSVEVYGVETEKTCTLVESLKKKQRIFVEPDPTSIALELGANIVGPNAFVTMKNLVDKMIVVKEEWVSKAVLRLAEEDKIIVEPSGAVSVASIIAGLYPQLKGKRVVCILSGSNMDSTTIGRVLEHGLAVDGRLVKFKVRLRDSAGAMSTLCTMLSDMGITIHTCSPNRTWVQGEVFEVTYKLVVETKGWDHTRKLVEQIKHNYNSYKFLDNGETHKARKPPRGPCLAPNPVCMQK